MHWQEPVALGVVVMTAALLVWRWLRRRPGVRSAAGCGCGCPGAGAGRSGEQVTYRARKGQRARWIVRTARLS